MEEQNKAVDDNQQTINYKNPAVIVVVIIIVVLLLALVLVFRSDVGIAPTPEEEEVVTDGLTQAELEYLEREMARGIEARPLTEAEIEYLEREMARGVESQPLTDAEMAYLEKEMSR